MQKNGVFYSWREKNIVIFSYSMVLSIEKKIRWMNGDVYKQWKIRPTRMPFNFMDKDDKTLWTGESPKAFSTGRVAARIISDQLANILFTSGSSSGEEGMGSLGMQSCQAYSGKGNKGGKNLYPCLPHPVLVVTPRLVTKSISGRWDSCIPKEPQVDKLLWLKQSPDSRSFKARMKGQLRGPGLGSALCLYFKVKLE